MNELTVVIATHNRPYLLLETIASVLNQDYKNFYFVVSDNSDNDDTFNVLKEKSLLKYFEYKKRNNTTDHYNIILNEIKTKYFILFHDDDIMLPGMVGKLIRAISSDDSIVAAGCNCFIYKSNKLLKKSMLRSCQDLLLEEQKSLVLQYCHNFSIVPFPSYIYNADIIKHNKIYFSDYAGKHADVIWLLEIMKFGKILWIKEPLMLYRVHEGQDSAQFSYKDQQELVLYYSKILLDGKKNRILKKYRIMNIYVVMQKRLKQKNRLSYFTIKQVLLLFYYSPFKFFIKYCVKFIISRLALNSII